MHVDNFGFDGFVEGSVFVVGIELLGRFFGHVAQVYCSFGQGVWYGIRFVVWNQIVIPVQDIGEVRG